MKTCGIELKGNFAIVVLLDGTRTDFSIIETGITKVDLSNDEDQQEIRNFQIAIKAYLQNYGINKVAIKKRATRGRYAGGSVSFKMEALIQVIEGISVSLISPNRIVAFIKKHPVEPPSQLFSYQETAFLTAYSILPE